MGTGSTNAHLFVVIGVCEHNIAGNIFSDRCRAREAVEALYRILLWQLQDGGVIPHRMQ